ncbi:MAG TPA: response regulator, partial [Steroidobacteraceae bacterium]|nr:response regulator [Steroidobacteraceae bacterium]
VNAEQAMVAHTATRTLTVITRLDDSRSSIQSLVSDTGPGIPENVRNRIFEPYFTTKPIGTGTGVGLAVSLGMVEAHGGSITLERSTCAGSTFVVTLPITAVTHVDGSPRSESAHALRILIVEDENDVRDTLIAILSADGHSIEFGADGSQALQLLGKHRFDVVISDLRMPVMDGPTLFGEIQRRWPDLASRVIFMTGDNLTASASQFLEQSGRIAIEKPFTPAEIRAAVASVRPVSIVHAD